MRSIQPEAIYTHMVS